MNKKEFQETINYVSKFLKPGEMRHLNCIRLRNNVLDGRGDKHNRAIMERCLEYLKLGVPFVTEAQFLSVGRCDILKPILIPEIEEILVSETKERFEAKNYPFKTKAIRIK